MIFLPQTWEGVLLIVALAGIFGGAITAFVRGESSRGAQRAAAVLGAGGAIAGLIASIAILVWGSEVPLIECASGVIDARVTFVVDALSASFLAPLFVVAALGSIYGLGYSRGERRLVISHGLLVGATALVFMARDGFSFLVVWEIMAISAFVAATADDRGAKVRAAGLAYLIATHTGTLFLLVMVVLLRERAGSFSWIETLGAPTDWLAAIIFVLAVIGFGFKAGFVPVHFWLPAAHANAPSHVSATMSAVMLKTGIYGILRITSLFDATPLWWGTTMIVVGATSALVGIALASGQTDIKRMLAYSSVENLGIVCVAVGLAMIGRGTGRVEWIAMGIGAAVLHVWNHALFKSLLFFGAGAIVHATGTREMEHLGGLMQKMPKTAALMGFGAIAAAGLPPLNGFVGEWVLYLGLFDAWTSAPEIAIPTAFAIVALATVGALAVAAFVRLVGVTLLGAPRTEHAKKAHDPGMLMLAPMIALAVLCAAIAIAFPLLLELTAPVASAWSGIARSESVTVLSGLSTTWITGLALAVAAIAAIAALRIPRRTAEAGTWDCGYAAPSVRMQYTGRSFGEWISERLTPAFLRAKNDVTVPSGLFPAEARFSADAPDPFQAKVYEPFLRTWTTRFFRARMLQQGKLNIYLLYTLITLVVLLIYAALPLALVDR